MADKIVIYGKQGCPFTDKARAAYGSSAIYIDVEADKAKLQEMITLSGGERKVPVIVEGGKVKIGYGGT